MQCDVEQYTNQRGQNMDENVASNLHVGSILDLGQSRDSNNACSTSTAHHFMTNDLPRRVQDRLRSPRNVLPLLRSAATFSDESQRLSYTIGWDAFDTLAVSLARNDKVRLRLPRRARRRRSSSASGPHQSYLQTVKQDSHSGILIENEDFEQDDLLSIALQGSSHHAGVPTGRQASITHPSLCPALILVANKTGFSS